MIKSDEYRIVEIDGKYGKICLIVPNKKPTKEEWVELHHTIAEAIINSYKKEQRNGELSS